MGIAYFIGFCCVGYWIYFSIKKEGLLWIPKALTAIGFGVLFFWSVFAVGKVLADKDVSGILKFAYFIGFVGFWYYMQMEIVMKLVDKFEEKIKERIGHDPYKKNKLTPEQEQIQVYKEALILDEIM